MTSLADLINALESKMPLLEQKNETVSKASVGWHIEHSLLALVKMISAAEHSNPADYKREFNFKRIIVLTLGKFPRGKARAPDSVTPKGGASTETIIPLIAKARQKTDAFEKLSSDKFFKHPVFGDLQVKQARKIIGIHTSHHIKIINDIINKQGR